MRTPTDVAYDGLGQAQGLTIIWYMNGTTVRARHPCQVSDHGLGTRRTGDSAGMAKQTMIMAGILDGNGRVTYRGLTDASGAWMGQVSSGSELYPLDRPGDRGRGRSRRIGDRTATEGRPDGAGGYHGTGRGSGLIGTADPDDRDRSTRIPDTDWQGRYGPGISTGMKGRRSLWRYYGTGRRLGNDHHLVHGRDDDSGPRPPVRVRLSRRTVNRRTDSRQVQDLMTKGRNDGSSRD